MKKILILVLVLNSAPALCMDNNVQEKNETHTPLSPIAVRAQQEMKAKEFVLRFLNNPAQLVDLTDKCQGK